MQKRTLLVILLSMLAVSAASARAGAVCPAWIPGAARGYCSLSASAPFSVGRPSFAVLGVSRSLVPATGMDALTFNVTFSQGSFGVASFFKKIDPLAAGMPGRQTNGSDGNGVFGGGYFFNNAPDGWFHRPSGDGWLRYHRNWSFGYSGSGANSQAGSLDTTPEPLTLVLFGTGLLFIAFLARRRAAKVSAGEQSTD